MTIVIDEERLKERIKRSKWLQPESYLTQLFCVICEGDKELTPRVQMEWRQEYVSLPISIPGNANTWKLLDRADGPCEPLQVGWTDPRIDVGPGWTATLHIYWSEIR